MNAPVSRRSVLKGVALGATAPMWVRFAEPAFAATAPATKTPRHLLVVFLRGGNDALQTIAPMGNAALTKLRPTVGLRDSDMVAMGNGYGINKSLPRFLSAWQAGQLAVIQQVGAANLDFSHTNSTRKWETGDPDDRFATGWLGRYLDAVPAVGRVRAAAFGDSLPLSLIGDHTDPLTTTSLAAFQFSDVKLPDAAARHAALGQLAQSTAPAGSMFDALLRAQRELLGAADPLTSLAASKLNGQTPTNAQSVAQLFASGLGTEIGFLNLGSFDTHTNERGRHADVAIALNDIVEDFFTTATSLGVADNSVMLIVSEFGRRVYENKSGGTDHGEAGSVFALGSSVKGGMYGPGIDLSLLDGGNLPVRVDLRSVYASVLEQWLRTNPTPILGATVPTIPLFR